MQLFWKIVWRFLKKLKIEQPYDTAIPLWGIYVSKNHRNTYLKRFIYLSVQNSAVLKSHVMEATQMPISRGTDKQKLAHTYKGILFHLKNKEILSHATA